MTFDEFLTRHEACGEAITWKGNRDFVATWNECQRPEWMLWILERVPCDQSKLRLLACDFVRRTPLADGRQLWDLLTDERSRNAVVIAERYAVGKATDEELAAAWDAAWNAAWDAAWDAARTDQYALLCRYLSGEQGPFVEADDD